MTNNMIIMLESVKLMEEGLLEGTGEVIVVEDAEGNEKELQMPEPIHTYATWKQLGYQVKKGEHAIAKFPIWKHTSKKDEDGEEKERMFMKTASFFKPAQVEKIVKGGE